MSTLTQAVRKALSEITPYPWTADIGNWQVESNQLGLDSYRDGICCFGRSNRDGLDGRQNPIDPVTDAEFIANSPTWLAQLCDRVEKYEDALKFYAGLAGDSEWECNQFLAFDKFGGLCKITSGPYVAIEALRGSEGK